MYVKKTTEEIEKMAIGGQIAAQILKDLKEFAKVGVTGLAIDQRARELMRKNKVQPSFLGYHDFPASICLSVNEVILHGIPNRFALTKNDLVTIDLGLIFEGLHVDTAISFCVSEKDEEVPKDVNHFLEVGQRSLREAIQNVQIASRIGDISHAMEKVIKENGYNVVRTYTGHGVGRKLHEPPSIPCYGEEGTGEVIGENETLAVEVMYMMGKSAVKTLPDGWTTVTIDDKLAAMFEHTVLTTLKGPRILTETE